LRPSCPRLFEVEAMRDGRLAGPELSSFARHMSTCDTCAGEAKALDALAEASRARHEEPIDELHVARERTRLLAAFDRSLLAAERRSSGWLVPLSAIAVVCGVFLFWRSRPSFPLSAPSSAVIHADPDTAWSKDVEAGVEKVVLVRGVLAIHVDHGTAHRQRLVVVLPDGELEDIGTTFRVSAANGHTKRVTVQEGSVLLRLRGRPPVALSAGESWPPEAPTAGASTPMATPPPAEERPARIVPSHKERASSSPVPVISAPVGRNASNASEDFRAIVRLLDAGADCRAAAGFLRFASDHPSDSRAEDAAYLRVIALHRCGSDDEMKEAAREYLAVYPRGFRRAEVERLSQ
jgi:hypothetical protein